MKKNLTKNLIVPIAVGMSICSTSIAQSLMTGPSTTTTPYLWPATPNATVRSILTVGDVIGSYTMAGIGDGMGMIDNGGSTFTLVMNHEMGSTVGSVRAHGQSINKSNLQVNSGSDLIQNVKLWAGTTYTTFNATNTSSLTAFGRFCSADLPPVSALYNSASGKGTLDRIFMNGEETGPEGRAFAHLVTGTEAGTTYELPHLGHASWENAVSSPFMQDKTIVGLMDDATPGQVYFYVGQKSSIGTAIEKAGLFGGTLYGVSVVGFYNEGSSVPTPGTTFNLVSIGSPASIAAATGSLINTNSNNLGVTNFLRPEDGAWDPNRPTDFYFVTTNSFTSPSRLWRLRFNDIANPELGGKIEAVLAGTEGQKMLDNICFDNHGHMILQEDPGNQNWRARMYQYKISTDVLTTVLDEDSTRFQTGGVNFLTIDEENSGVIDAQSALGAGWFLSVHQAHYPLPNPMVEGGQLMAFFNPATAAANAELDVTGNSASIPDGNTSTSTSNNTNFGLANVGTPVSKTFVLQNTNTGTLIVSSLWMTGNNAGDFVITGPNTPFTIGANGSQSVTVTFMPGTTGARTAMLNVSSSDFDEATYNFAVEGAGAVPEINIQGNSITIPSGNTAISIADNTDFGTVYLGNSMNEVFTIQNTSTGTLTINSVNISGLNSNEFTWVNPPSFPLTISSNGSQALTLKFLPLSAGTRSAKIWFNSNDADEASYTFDVQGKGAIDVGLATVNADNSSNIIIFPNPSNNQATLKFVLDNTSSVAVNLFDIQGKLALSIPTKEYQKGEQTISINTSTLANGEYFIKLNSGSTTQTVKLIVVH
jgi:hypothetical protein